LLYKCSLQMGQILVQTKLSTFTTNTNGQRILVV
jgi:hypothetical protein